MLKIENLHVAVGDKKVLNGLDLEIPTGEPIVYELRDDLSVEKRYGLD